MVLEKFTRYTLMMRKGKSGQYFVNLNRQLRIFYG